MILYCNRYSIFEFQDPDLLPTFGEEFKTNDYDE